MGDMCPIGNMYYMSNGESLIFSLESVDSIEVFCRCCFEPIKTKTAFHLDTSCPIGNVEPDNRWYCHKCFKALKKAHKGD